MSAGCEAGVGGGPRAFRPGRPCVKRVVAVLAMGGGWLAIAGAGATASPGLAAELGVHGHATAHAGGEGIRVKRLTEGTPYAGAMRMTGAHVCAECHAEIFASWRETPHARGYEVLTSADRQVDPVCLGCHATGSGDPAGFVDAHGKPYFAGVQCEACHGPGSRHVRLPGRGTIARAIGDDFCAECHTEAASPGFTADPAAYRRQVVHPAPSIGSPLAGTAGPDREITVEFYTMSLCPYGGEAAAELAALRDSLGSALTVEVHYIVRMAEGGTRERTPGMRLEEPPFAAAAGAACIDDGTHAVGLETAGAAAAGDPLARGFTSLHGPREVVEDLRQIVIAERYPALLLRYLARRAGEPEEDWRLAAVELGMDPALIEPHLAAARTRLAADAERVRALGIDASPTLRLHGAIVDEPATRSALGRAFCRRLSPAPAPCRTLPRCDDDRDCRAPGVEGRCIDGGTARARCTERPAPPVTLHVLNDPECGPCNPVPVVSAARSLFARLEVTAHDIAAGEGAEWIETFGIAAAPAFVFVGAESSLAYPVIRDLVVRGGDGDAVRAGNAVLLDPAIVRGPLAFRREPEPGVVDLFLDATGPESLMFMRSLSALMSDAAADAAVTEIAFRVHHVLDVTPAPRAVLVQRGDEAHVVPAGAPMLASRLGSEDLAEARRQACIAHLAGGRILDYLIARAESGESGAGDWRQRLNSLDIDPGAIGFCAGSGGADSILAADRELAAELRIRTPAALVANRLRFDSLGPWNASAFRGAVAASAGSSSRAESPWRPIAPPGATREEETP